MNAATITIRRSPETLEAAATSGAALKRAFGEDSSDFRFSFIPAPEGRGTEIHVSSASLDRKQLKAGLRKYRALVEAGEVPTGARTR